MTDKFPKIALVQMEVKPGRPDLNVEAMVRFIKKARENKAEIVVFSELCVSGYVIGDLWEVDELVIDFATQSELIREASQAITVVFGNVAIDSKSIGEDGRIRKYNAVYVCNDGQYSVRPQVPDVLPTHLQPKTLHPNYRFFDDDRHFYSLRMLAEEKGCSVYDWMVPFEVELANKEIFRFGVQLCEDIWCQDYNYCGDLLDGLAAYRNRGVQAVFNLSASPWTWQKDAKRNRVVRDILCRSQVPFFYVNQIGAQNNGKNIIVFDGDSTQYSSDGNVVRRADPWTEQIVFVEDNRRSSPADKVDSNIASVQTEVESVYSAIQMGLRHLDYVRGEENRFLVGVSGGVDSSVVACMLVQTFGADRVFAVNMPTRYNSEITRDNARLVCERLNVDYLCVPIENIYRQVASYIKDIEFPGSEGSYHGLVDENIQARIRYSDILSGIAAKHGFVFTNNGNKTELALGYTTLYGDLGGAVSPIGDLYKVQVFELGRYLNNVVYKREVIPENLLNMKTVPSAELSLEQDVTSGKGDPIKYGYHDAVLRQMIEYRHHPIDFLRWYLSGELFDQLQWGNWDTFVEYFTEPQSWLDDLEWIAGQLRTSFFKRVQSPPIIVLSKRAFGFDLRETQRPAYQPRAYSNLRAQIVKRPWGLVPLSS